MEIALFDFDGTITKKDTLLGFFWYSNSLLKLLAGTFLLSPFLFLFFLGLLSNGKLKEILFSCFFKNYPEEKFKKLAAEFSRKKLDSYIKKNALERVIWHKKKAHRVFVVSASFECWLAPWCEKQGIELIANQLEVIQGRITGKIRGRNCYGEEKARRIKEYIKEWGEITCIWAYGDSRGDKAMLDLADKAFFQYF